VKRRIIWLIFALIVFVYFNNSSYFAEQRVGKPLLLAHRGLAQTFNMEGITNDTNTSKRIYPPEHPYLENTIPSMEAAFKAGADMVELDIQPTKEGQFVVFHDWTLEYRTNGTGVTRDYTGEELKLLDVGYGYSADGVKTFPFRGKGIGLMPTLDEVMSHFPDRSFLIHVKSNDPKEGEMLAQYLAKFPEGRLKQLTVYGGDKPVADVHAALPNVRVMSMATLKKSVLSYVAIGWTGYVPQACRHTEIHIPEKIVPWLWGWPNRFLNRMADVDTRVILVAGEGEFSTGFDTPEDIKRLPPNYTGGIWTNRIDKIAPLFVNK
jgi:glycerophosphoryl diester phosphodiesterase